MLEDTRHITWKRSSHHSAPFPHFPAGNQSLSNVRVSRGKGVSRLFRSEEQDGAIDRVTEGTAQKKLTPFDEPGTIGEVRRPVRHALALIVGDHVVKQEIVRH